MSILSSILRDDPTGKLVMFWCDGCGKSHKVNKDYWNGSTEAPSFSLELFVWSPWRDIYPKKVCRSRVSDGIIQYLGDCTHAFVGMAVPIPLWDKEHDNGHSSQQQVAECSDPAHHRAAPLLEQRGAADSSCLALG